ncbi:hypothetical protein [Monoglobus pectinilyticus]|uniref:hypothetical protein n=1 Tax=Monoglobus pectinilyticus TaxID=1981510 RepID=UPI002A766C28|nr:hypothetical protein [Monoglobus pectinilyticus]MEE0734222.1 hypothetical protein [Monoglobus pectinilyticus]
MKKITIFFSVIVVIIVFVMISYMKSSNVEFDYKNINNIEIVSEQIFNIQGSDKIIRKTIDNEKEIQKYIRKINHVKFYKSSDTDFGQRDFTTMITINNNDGSKIKILFVSIQCRIQRYDENKNLVESNRELYYLSPISIYFLTHI